MAKYILLLLIILPHIFYANLLHEYKIKSNDQLKKFTQSYGSYIFVQSYFSILQLNSNLKCVNVFKKNDLATKSCNNLKNISINHSCVNYIAFASNLEDYLFADCNCYSLLGVPFNCESSISNVNLFNEPEYFGVIVQIFNENLNGDIFHALSHGREQQGFLKILNSQTFVEKQSVLFGKGQEDVDISIIQTYYEFPYIYLIYQHSLSSSSDEKLSFIVQLCPDNISNSMVELQISCIFNNEIYTDAIMATLVSGRLFILFRNNDNSVVCVYKQTNIVDIISTSIIKCLHDGIGMKGLNFIHNIMTPCIKLNVTIENIYCGQSEYYQSIFSSFSPTIERNIFIKEIVNAIFVEAFRDLFYFIYIASSNGDIQKIIWDITKNNISRILIFKNYKDVLQILNGTEQTLTLLNKNSIINIEKQKCNNSLNCNECLLDPHCAWCLVNQKCIIFTKCDSTEGVFYGDKCPHVISINQAILKETKNENLFISLNQLENVTFSVENMHDYMKKLKLTCSFGKLGTFPIKEIITLPDGISLISCNIQDKIKLSFQIENVDLNILYGEDNLNIPKKTNYTVEIYSCNHMALNCGQCLLIEANYDCVWCRSETCLHLDDCIGGHYIKGVDGNICPLPTIISIFPPGGSPMGGTLVTVIGTNLGFSLDELKIAVLGIPCDVMPELEPLYVKTEKVVCKTGALPLLTNETKGLVSVVVGGRYSARSTQLYTYAIPTINSFSPAKGPRSGGTKVSITGTLLDHGNNVVIQICNSSVNFLRRDSNVVEFLTPLCEHLSLAHAPISVKIDNDKVKVVNDIPVFLFQEDPVVTKIDPNYALYSGGNILSIRGLNLNSVVQPNLVVYLAHQEIITQCNRFPKQTFLECPTPRLSQINNISNLNPNNSEWLQVDWGLIMDGVKGVRRFSSEEEGGRVLKYGEDPLVENLPKNLKFKPNSKLEIMGQNLRKFHRFTDFVVQVDNVTCKNMLIEKNRITCDPPNFNENKEIASVIEANVIVQLGNLVRNIGTLDYRQHQPLSVFFILAIALPLLIIMLIVIAIIIVIRSKCRCCKLKSKNKMCKKNANSGLYPENIALVDQEKLQSKKKKVPTATLR